MAGNPDHNLRNVVRGLRDRPEMYLGQPRTLSSVRSFLDGYDCALTQSGGDGLNLFRLWLKCELRGRGGNLNWYSLVQMLHRAKNESEEGEEAVLRSLFLYLEQYLEAKQDHGREGIVHRFKSFDAEHFEERRPQLEAEVAEWAKHWEQEKRPRGG